jgi:hypothetical protein
MRIFESNIIIFTGPFMHPQSVKINIMRDGGVVFGNIHGFKAVCGLNSVPAIECRNALVSDFKPKVDFIKEEVLIYNGFCYKHGLLNITVDGDILIYCDQDRKKGFEVEGYNGFKDITFGYKL